MKVEMDVVKTSPICTRWELTPAEDEEIGLWFGALWVWCPPVEGSANTQQTSAEKKFWTQNQQPAVKVTSLKMVWSGFLPFDFILVTTTFAVCYHELELPEAVQTPDPRFVFMLHLITHWFSLLRTRIPGWFHLSNWFEQKSKQGRREKNPTFTY